MWRTPVTFGGGITMTKGFFLGSPAGWNNPLAIQSA